MTQKHLLFLVLICFYSYHSFAKKHINITFHISDSNGEPKREVNVRIVKYHNPKSNARHEKHFGSYSENDTNFKNGELRLKLSADQYSTTRVNISFTSFHDFHKIYTIENVLLQNGDKFDVEMQFDSVQYKNAKQMKLFCGSGNIPLYEEVLLKNKCFKIGIFESDIDSHPEYKANYLFSIDSACMITNRQILKQSATIKTDLMNLYLDNVQNEIILSKVKCIPLDTLVQRISW